jgi:hypothetical protein
MAKKQIKKQAKKQAKGQKKKPARRKPQNRFEELIDLQLDAIQYWGEYAQSAAKLISKGTYDPVPWTEQYKTLSAKMVGDFGKIVGIVAGDKR